MTVIGVSLSKEEAANRALHSDAVNRAQTLVGGKTYED